MPVDLLQFMYEFGLLLFVLLLIIYCLILVTHFSLPKNILRSYFKPPYFKAAEVALFSGFPLGFIRTIMFMRVIGFPESGAKRGLHDVHKAAPRWVHITSRILLSSFVVIFSGVLFILLVFFIEMLISGDV